MVDISRKKPNYSHVKLEPATEAELANATRLKELCFAQSIPFTNEFKLTLKERFNDLTPREMMLYWNSIAEKNNLSSDKIERIKEIHPVIVVSLFKNVMKMPIGELGLGKQPDMSVAVSLYGEEWER